MLLRIEARIQLFFESKSLCALVRGIGFLESPVFRSVYTAHQRRLVNGIALNGLEKPVITWAQVLESYLQHLGGVS